MVNVNRRRDRGAVIAPFALLALSVITAVALARAFPDRVAPEPLPWALALAVVAAALRVRGTRTPDATRGAANLFWASTVVTLGLVLLNPAFGLYAFVGYPDATNRLRGRENAIGLVAVAAVCSLAQTGGVRSPLFTPVAWVIFLSVNLVIAVTMATLDRQRQRTVVALQHANDELRLAHERNTSLQAQLLDQARLAGAGEERSRLAREIHDTIAQDLVAIITQLGVIAEETDPAAQRRRLDQVEESARAALGEARRSVQALSSPRLDSDDLPAALRRLLTSWKDATSADVDFEVTGAPRPSLHDDVVLRIAQEALANVARHAQAGRARVRLRYPSQASADSVGSGRHGCIGIEIADDGVGFDAGAGSPAWHSGHGLAGMAERARGAGGEARVTSQQGAGTTVTAMIPGRWR